MTSELLGVTIGVGPEYGLLAQEAARRLRHFTGLEVRVLDAADLRRTGVRDPNRLKFRLFDLVDADNLLFFDADCFCLRPWDPRPLAGRPDWVGVRGFWFDERVRRLGELYGFGDDTINSGLFLCNRTHHARVLRLAEALKPDDDAFPGLVNPDEIALSTALHALGVPTHFLDRRYNWIQYGRGSLTDVADVVVAHACHPTLRPHYLAPGALAGALPAAQGGAELFAKLAGQTFVYERLGHDLRPLHFRGDGTIGAGGGDAERYYVVAPGGALTLGSALDQTGTLTEVRDGVWHGRWSVHERMAVTLTRHRAQVLLDRLGPRGRQPLVGAEVGVYRGETAALLLRGLPGLHLYLLDPWRATARDAIRRQADCDEALAQAAAATAFAAGRRTLLPCGHEQAAAFVPDGLDLVFLDGDHSETATHAAIETWWPKVASGGLLAGHDYDNPKYPGVRRAVDAFAARHGLAVGTGPDLVWYYEGQP